MQIENADLLAIATAAAATNGKDLESWIDDAIRNAAKSKAERRKHALDEIQQAQVEIYNFFVTSGHPSDVALGRAKDLQIIAGLIAIEYHKEISDKK